MSVLDSARILIFRCHQKGLEILTIDNKIPLESKIWKSAKSGSDLTSVDGLITLEEQKDELGKSFQPIAVEADWYQIPSIRALLKHDIKRLGNKLKTSVELHPELNFVEFKVVLQQALPHEFRALNELKEIIVDRNQLNSI